MKAAKAPRERTILDTLDDARLFRKTFRRPLLGLGRDSWQAWRVFLAALFGLPLTAEQRKIYYEHTHRTDLPAKAYRESYLVCGRRSGKSLISALIGVYAACFIDHSESLVSGERGVVAILSCDRKQARIIFNYVVGFLQTPLLRNLIEGEIRKESIDLTNGISIEVTTADFRSVRGKTIVCAVLDELAFMDDDEQLLHALRPSMLSIPRALLLGVSSPYGRRGELWRNYNLYFGQKSDTLVWQGASLDMNPTLPKSEVEKAFQRDPLSAASEFNAQFREEVSEFISMWMIAERTATDVKERPYEEGKKYYAFCDASGGRNDSAVLAVAHFEHQQAILDLIREIEAPHAPASACREFAGIAKAYRVHEIAGDRYSTSFIAEHFEKHGVRYRGCERTRSELYLEILPALMSGTVVLLDNATMAAQFVGLERKPGKNRDSIDHRQNSHDDVANAVAGVLVEVLAENATASLGLLDWEKSVASGERRDPRVELPRVRSESPKPKANDPCPACQSTCTILMSGGSPGKLVLHCNACSATDGQLPPELIGQCCPNFLPQHVSGMVRCGNCGAQHLTNGKAVPLAAKFSNLRGQPSRAGWFGNLGRFG